MACSLTGQAQVQKQTSLKVHGVAQPAHIAFLFRAEDRTLSDEPGPTDAQLAKQRAAGFQPLLDPQLPLCSG